MKIVPSQLAYGDTVVAANSDGTALAVLGRSYGPLYVYRDIDGVRAVVRANSWDAAFGLLPDADLSNFPTVESLTDAVAESLEIEIYVRRETAPVA